MSTSASESSVTKPNLWIKQPLSCFTANNNDAANGVVICGDRIIELVAEGQQPTSDIHQIFDAR